MKMTAMTFTSPGVIMELAAVWREFRIQLPKTSRNDSFAKAMFMESSEVDEKVGPPLQAISNYAAAPRRCHFKVVVK